MTIYSLSPPAHFTTTNCKVIVHIKALYFALSHMSRFLLHKRRMPVLPLLQGFPLCIKSYYLLPSLIPPLALPAFPEEYDIISWQRRCRLSYDMIHIRVSVILLHKSNSFLCPDTCYNSLQCFPAEGTRHPLRLHGTLSAAL